MLVRKKAGMKDVGLLQQQPQQQSSNSRPSSGRPPAPTPPLASTTHAPAGSGGSDTASTKSTGAAQPIASSLWSTVGGMLGYGGGNSGDEGEGSEVAKVQGEAERVHVFSLATGHLYERFLKVKKS